MKGLIFNVRRYSVHDGPGIRVSFFLKGCPLKCLWCHNPEGISPYPESVTRSNRVGARIFTGMEEVGKYYTVEDIMEILDKEKVFLLQSGGGVTFTGGEPMLQSEFLIHVLKNCKEKGYHTCVDTSGYAYYENFKSIIPFTDLFLFDLKHLDNVRHNEITGCDNTEIIRNYHLLLESGKDIMLRIPVIPGYNDDNNHLDNLRRFIIATKTDSIRRISLLPYHKIGSSKYKRLNLPYSMDNVQQPSSERMKELKEFFSVTGIKVKIGG